jgi:hypothetical protein
MAWFPPNSALLSNQQWYDYHDCSQKASKFILRSLYFFSASGLMFWI